MKTSRNQKWFCVDALTFRSAARCVKNASTSDSPISCGCRQCLSLSAPSEGGQRAGLPP
jgi:hypothetical protein